ncbi:MAG: ribonuclease P [Candidatus Aenigmarchaeota archaeon]|nr:ribonuclease P [Candidatus Aenigmarchaeota archaeon]MDW8149536.1 ribonuclease P [Candidatus Aenigmarchaeota archaeon]
MKSTEKNIKRIARERVEILLKLANEKLKTNPELSKRYIQIAREICMRTNIRLGKYKRIFCKKCNTILVPGYTSVVRIERRKKIVKIICKSCGEKYRYPTNKPQ